MSAVEKILRNAQAVIVLALAVLAVVNALEKRETKRQLEGLRERAVFMVKPGRNLVYDPHFETWINGKWERMTYTNHIIWEQEWQGSRIEAKGN